MTLKEIHRKIPVRKTVEILIESAKGVRELHSRGCVHRGLSLQALKIFQNEQDPRKGKERVMIGNLRFAVGAGGHLIAPVVGSELPPRVDQGTAGNDVRHDLRALGAMMLAVVLREDDDIF